MAAAAATTDEVGLTTSNFQLSCGHLFFFVYSCLQITPFKPTALQVHLTLFFSVSPRISLAASIYLLNFQSETSYMVISQFDTNKIKQIRDYGAGCFYFELFIMR